MGNLAREFANEMVQRRREECQPIDCPKKLNADELEHVNKYDVLAETLVLPLQG